MKNVVFWLGFVILAGVMSVMVLHKEQVIASGQTVLLRLAPVDPRSLFQGDYMDLRYRVAREVPDEGTPDEGCLVLRLDENDVGHFVRVQSDAPLHPLEPNEILLRYKRRGEVRIGAESFFFEEGKADHYGRARYGELKVESDGKSVLIGLRDEEFKKL